MTRETFRGQQVPASVGSLFHVFSNGLQPAKVVGITVKLTIRLIAMHAITQKLKTLLRSSRSSELPIPTFKNAIARPLHNIAKVENFMH
ncbi:hypothetical protein I7I53_01551 [Histoplasma capsulatum var. duboisii H88]|uniref:Uncharacterized protein n=1 Tax=Ajellomyces capsulatus (strain H88) TaxID=544711 RepID=A0A8A1LNR7_AJEC8|nr:hypothetical protein I7I53_01551 [Histoplasma capsulatum var. duboisii H88]